MGKLRIPIWSDYQDRKTLALQKDIKNYITAARELFEGAAVNTGVGSILSILIDEDSKLERFKEVSIDDYPNTPIPDQVMNMVKTNPNLSQMQTVYSVLIAQDHKITADTDSGQRIIDEYRDMFQEKNNPWSLAVQHMASSIITRGNVLMETEFDESRNLLGIHVVDTKWYKAELIQEEEGQRWYIGRYIDGKFKKIESPNIRFQGINTLVGDRLAR